MFDKDDRIRLMKKRYSEAFKRQGVSEYEDDQSANALGKKYGIARPVASQPHPQFDSP
jgi:hypothetical protein